MKLPSGLNRSQLRTATHEGGVVNKAYWDPIGKCWTVGIGCTGPDIVEGTEWDDDKCKSEFLILHNKAEVGAETDIGPIEWSKLNDARKSALTDTAFQQGVLGLAGYHKMISAILIEDWTTSKNEMINSKADKQTPGRCEENAQILLTGQWPGDINIITELPVVSTTITTSNNSSKTTGAMLGVGGCSIDLLNWWCTPGVHFPLPDDAKIAMVVVGSYVSHLIVEMINYFLPKKDQKL